MTNVYGNYIYEQRIQKGIKSKDLASGLLSPERLSKFEHGACMLDKPTVEALFQRLSLGFDKLEFEISSSEYNVLLIKQLLLESIIDENKIESERYYSLLHDNTQTSSIPLYRQFNLMVHAVINCLFNDDALQSSQIIEQALSVTELDINRLLVPKDSFLICTQEAQCILIWIELNWILEQNDSTRISLLTSLFHLYNKSSDLDEVARIFPLICYMLSREYLKVGSENHASIVCNEGLKCLRRSGSIFFATELLSISHLCSGSPCFQYPDQLIESISFIEQTFSLQKLSGKSVLICIISLSHQDELYINCESIRDTRNGLNYSQEELSWNICSQETLSRIETGTRNANRKNISKLKEKMGIDKNIYSGYVVSSSYDIILKVREHHRSWYNGSLSTAKQLFDEIKSSLNMSNRINQQYVLICETMFQVKNSSIDLEKAIDNYDTAIEMTMADYRIHGIYRVPSRNELDALCQKIICLKRLKKYNDAHMLICSAICKYQSSRVSLFFHSRAIKSLEVAYAGLLELMNMLDSSEAVASDVIKKSYREQKGDIIAQVVGNLSCVYEKRATSSDLLLCESCLKADYYLMTFYNHINDAEIVRQYYKSVFSKDLF